jgi:glycosyltransferase involved in cell wall biosynthesis
VRTVVLGQRFGFYGAVAFNVGAALATTSFIAKLDDDDEFLPGALDYMEQRLVEDDLKTDIWIPGGLWNDGRITCIENGDPRNGNIIVPVIRTRLFTICPIRPREPLAIMDYFHVMELVAAGATVQWFGKALYAVRPKLPGYYGQGSEATAVATSLDIIIPTCKPAAEVQPLVDEIQRTTQPPTRVFATCQPVSAAQNRNIGLEWTQAPYVIMCDDDITGLQPGWATKLTSVFEQYPNCVMVSPQLMQPDGRFAFMMGGGIPAAAGLSVAPHAKLPTACVAVRKNALRFDEAYLGSGFEDDDYALQLCNAVPNAMFMINHDVQVVHRNEAKNQGVNWEHNKAYFERKWHCT